MTGGAGKDIFYFSENSVSENNFLLADIITDFQDGVDLLKLYGDLKFDNLVIEDSGLDYFISIKDTNEHIVVIQNAADLIGLDDFA